MKKILSLGIASAVLAMTALSASAALVVRTDSDVTEGATITVDFVVDADTSTISFKTKATGMELVDATSPKAGPLCIVSDDKKGIGAVTEFKAGEVVFTQTYKVTETEGKSVGVEVTDLQGVTGVAPTLTVTVKKAGGTSTPSDSGTSTPSDSGTSTPSDSGSSSTTNPGNDNNPGTGVALAVFPAVLAGAAVVVAKKKRG